MACKKCGGVRSKINVEDVPTYEVIDHGGASVRISPKAMIFLQGLPSGELRFKVGKVIKVSATAAADLLDKGAPIWILT